MRRYRTVVTAALVLFALVFSGSSRSQTVPMFLLWPNEDGLRWEYELTVRSTIVEQDVTVDALLEFDGTIMTPAGERQDLVAQHGDVPDPVGDPSGEQAALLSMLEQRDELASRIAGVELGTGKDQQWLPILLHGGGFLQTDDVINMWHVDSNDVTWTFLDAPIFEGAGFTDHLGPQNSLHCVIVDTEAAVATPAGLFDNAVEVYYLLDMGLSYFTDEGGEVLGVAQSEIRGTVHYVPEVGPVAAHEEFIPFVWADCGDEECPPVVTANIGVAIESYTLSLTTSSTPNEKTTWGAVKAQYR